MSDTHIEGIAIRLGVDETEARQFCVRVQQHFTSGGAPSVKLIAGLLKMHGRQQVTPEEIAQQIRAAYTQRAKQHSPGGSQNPGRESYAFTPLIAHDPRPHTDGLEKCPHGVLKIKKCAICDPEGFRLEHGWD